MKKLFCLILILSMTLSLSFAEEGLPSFSTTDMEGNTVTQDIFADYDLTVVNIWTTWCIYCINEMPALAQFKTMLPENVNFITLCEEASTEMELAEQILQASGANFQTLVANQDMIDQYLYNVYSIPTTLFLDSNGLPVRSPVVGVPSLENPADAYYGLMQGALRMMREDS